MIQAKPPTTPAPTRGAVVAGAPGGTGIGGGPAAIYQALRAQRRELNNQLDELQSTQREIASQLGDLSTGDASRNPLETRMTEIDGRIATVDGMLASNSAQIAQAAAIPGAVVEPPGVVRNVPPEEAYILGGLFMLFFLFPISIAFARRIWRRSSTAVAAFPRELADRLSRMEQALEATAVEVERIGEGQRFLTRLLTEAEGARAIGAGAAQPVARKTVSGPEQLP